ncbi:hypothetical protein ACJ73_02703 [Blastomyces percursus]|uniref:Uncharacterized protein n=1 Tax=Blastomyces percursus TaxID=1658174 RepID=A0A1J9RBN2_9EURO|nr:hypothetical protein ACJ73_02703 [Blastomyces percursus]
MVRGDYRQSESQTTSFQSEDPGVLRHAIPHRLLMDSTSGRSQLRLDSWPARIDSSHSFQTGRHAASDSSFNPKRVQGPSKTTAWISLEGGVAMCITACGDGSSESCTTHNCFDRTETTVSFSCLKTMLEKCSQPSTPPRLPTPPPDSLKISYYPAGNKIPYATAGIHSRGQLKAVDCNKLWMREGIYNNQTLGRVLLVEGVQQLFACRVLCKQPSNMLSILADRFHSECEVGVHPCIDSLIQGPREEAMTLAQMAELQIMRAYELESLDQPVTKDGPFIQYRDERLAYTYDPVERKGFEAIDDGGV